MQIRNVLILGSGLMAESVVAYLLQRAENRIHIASNAEAEAKAIAEKRGLGRCTFSKVNVSDRNSLIPLVEKAQIVVSYVPAFLHVPIAKACLEVGRHMVTASYVSPEMQALDGQARKKGLLFLNQLGLDPGIDHLATMRTVDQIREKGGKIVEYESWCGGLPSPTCCDNPLGYKFTWSPIGAFKALRNKAVYIQDSKQFQIEPSKLLYYGATIELNQALSLEGYPNRDSVSYKDIYGLNDAKKVLRGTLRYKGFCEIISALKEIGLFEDSPAKGSNWLEYITIQLATEQGNTLQEKVWNRCVRKVSAYHDISQGQQMKAVSRIMHALKFFGLLDPGNKFSDPKLTSLEQLIIRLNDALSLKPGETDLVAMQHKFLFELGGKRFLRKSTLIQIGEKNGFSAMSLTVGMPTAIGTQLILDGKISARGVVRPVTAQIYVPVLRELEMNGIKLVEVDQLLE